MLKKETKTIPETCDPWDGEFRIAHMAFIPPANSLIIFADLLSSKTIMLLQKKNCCQTFDWHEQQKSRIYRCETWGIHITWWRNNCRPTLWLQIDCRISLCTPQGIEMTQSSFYSWDKTLEGQGVHKCSRFCDTQQMWHTSCYVLVLVLDSLLNKKVQKDWAETIQ